MAPNVTMDDEEKRKKGAFKEWLTAQGFRWGGGDNSIEEVIEYNLPDDELKKFKACCATIRQNIANAEAF
ncbi:MAG: hypothetical protein MR644_06780, partial [Megasphaera elsdenii]|nr:hypothetical protein [Megasphaera elsdenii]